MGLIQPKPYKRYDRSLNKWVDVIPEPVEYAKNEKRGGKLKIKTNGKSK